MAVGGGGARGGLLARNLEDSRDPDGFARLASAAMRLRFRTRRPATGPLPTAQILAAKGGDIAQITIGDLLELFDAEDAARSARRAVAASSTGSCARWGSSTHSPATLRALRSIGPRSPDELIDRYRLRCRPVRDLLVDYLRERQPALD